MTELFFIVSLNKSLPILKPMARACNRNGISWCCFFTGEGVKQLEDVDLVEVLANSKRAIVCEHSWNEFMGSIECPLELGSQTSNSEIITEAKKVISL